MVRAVRLRRGAGGVAHTRGIRRALVASLEGMHAYQHYANLVMLDACPSCQRPTAVIREYAPRSTRGRAPYRKVRCLRGHQFTLLMD